MRIRLLFQICGAINLDCGGGEEIIAIEETHYHSKFLCARAVCDDGDATFGLDDICKHKEECKNIQYGTDTCAVPDDTDHTYTCRTPWKKEIIDSDRLCDKFCDCEMCDDEAICNGITYGILCISKYSRSPYYQPAYFICDGGTDCFNGTDEMNCQEGPMCKKGSTSVTRPIVNDTRCAPLFLNKYPYCDDYSDQLNCTDSSIANLTCFRGGYPVSVADRMRCHGITGLRLCDDGFEDMCVRIDITCKVHKHQICDKVKDCFNGADELHVSCRSMSKSVCKRVFGMENRLLKVPLSWINDGYKDCEDGIDEGVVYPTCGLTPATMRLKKDDEQCGEVFLCGFPPSGHIEFEYLCDNDESCGNENSLCQKAFDSPGIHQKIDSYENQTSVSYCLKGLDKLAYVAGNCSKTVFGYQSHELLGRTQLLLNIPETIFDCKYVYGEMYVYLACVGQCAASICPLENPIRHDSCLGQYPSRVYTLADTNFLSFLVPYGDNKYHNNLFPCDNGLCIPYEQVCNLANDCGDFSDEILCNNHFQCPNSTEYIPLSSVCDGKPDCIDYSDECNDRCNVRIIENTVLTTVAWLLGSLATLLNLVIIIRGMYTFRKATTVAMLLNKILILLIAFGDLLIGIYLLAISIYHELQYYSYCPNRFEWLTSRSCAFMGIVNTVGSQLSLFSMTVLSLSRVLRMNKLSISNETTLKSSIPVFLIGTLILIASCLIAAVPLFEPFEDFFVNGINYPRSPLFVGSVSKFKHLEIFEEYFGRMRSKDLSWKNIDRLVVSMFSEEYGGITRNQVHFYGNAGVCLFKYFVTSDDSQRIYVWFTLFLNIICFAAITMAYIIIHFISAKSSSQCANNNENQQLKNRNKRLQRKITLIIGTDFCCWIPFIAMCFLHSLGVTDASPYYSLFSIVVLPINSVINPLLYDETVGVLLSKIVRVSRQQFRTEASAVTCEVEMNSTQGTSHVRAHTTASLGEMSPAMTPPEQDCKAPETVKLESQSGSRVEHQAKAEYVNVSQASQRKGVKKARVVREILNERLEEEETGHH